MGFCVWKNSLTKTFSSPFIYWYEAIFTINSFKLVDKATPTNNTDYSCHINAYNLFNQSYVYMSHHIMPLVINSLGVDVHAHVRARTHTHTYTHTHTHTYTHTHTHTHTNMHTYRHLHRNNFNKLHACWIVANARLF